jgi:hypothetical protein
MTSILTLPLQLNIWPQILTSLQTAIMQTQKIIKPQLESKRHQQHELKKEMIVAYSLFF